MSTERKASQYGRNVSLKLYAQIKFRVEAGVGYTKTAEELSRTRQTISIIAEEFPKTTLKNSATKAEKRTARGLKKQGLSEYYIAKLLGVRHGGLFA